MSTSLSIPAEANSAVTLIQQAISQGADPAYLRELLAVRREWEADEAKKAYFIAISDFQSRAPIIEKADDAHGKKYARMDRIWRTIKPLFTELGLSCTWQVCEVRDSLCHVEGQLAHIQGHSIPLIMDVALPELIRGQNVAQQVGSARTYAQRYAFCAAVGLQTGEDDDAASVGKISTDQADEIVALLRELPEWEKVRDGVLEWMGIDTLTDLQVTSFELVKHEVTRKIRASKQPKP
jgi:hypothetical protein